MQNIQLLQDHFPSQLLTPEDAAPVAVYLGDGVGRALKSDYVVIRIQVQSLFPNLCRVLVSALR